MSTAGMRVKLDIKKQFHKQLEGLPSKREMDAVLDEALSICQKWAISPEDLYFQWEAYSMDHDDAALSSENMRSLRRVVEQRQLAKAQATPRAGAPGAKSAKNGLLSTGKKARASFGSLLGGDPTSGSPRTDPITPSRPPSHTYGSTHHRVSSSGGSSKHDTSKTPLASRENLVKRSTILPQSKQGQERMDIDMDDRYDLGDKSADIRGATLRREHASLESQAIEVEGIKAAADDRHHHLPFQVIDTLNAHLDTHVDPAVRKGKVFLGMSIEPEKWAYRYMFEQKRAYTAALDERIDRMADVIEEFYELGPNPFGDPTVPSQDDIYVVGRICPAVPPPVEVASVMETARWAKTGVPKLSEAGVVLETSKKMGDGERVSLMFEADCKVRRSPPAPGAKFGDEDDGLLRTDRFGIFPGMLVGLKGRNGTGDAFSVQEVLLPPRLPEGTEEMRQLEKFQYSTKSMNGQPMKMMVAAGPFTSDSDLTFGPLEAIIQQALRDTPDILILLGPFLSRYHPILQSGHVDEFPEDIFRKRVSDRLDELLKATKGSGLRIALVPSTKDIVSAHAAFPQPMFEHNSKSDTSLGMFDKRTSLPDDKRLFRLPNPCAVWINECFVGLSTADVLRDVRSEEMVIQVEDIKSSNAFETATPDPLLRVCGHIISQRCFYPLYPSSPASNPPLPLDISHAHLADFVTVTPDILILPSVLNPCSKLLDPTICVNPGAAGGRKGDRGGTVAMVTIRPQQDLREIIEQAKCAGQSERDRIGYDIPGRTRVDILKL
ncbi:DNA polymerase alpha, subunit B [Tilletiaria anomala UBC 951]|uniref:DNA polymerase alpha subunit B n=1 Tax=Tilletiaria anomala (strain ATCC 24038 / CBS 436.72 / UBC 951) TaxID=1037660 RepID=A0A066VPW9_TILAU|nr:DNA polymerase alpha, subunit B [Tilletiaria anomala UBC 951]KDN42303.1 DNA polymerase alpha, subunit B [Tilletiaria anomala UBC 951]